MKQLFTFVLFCTLVYSQEIINKAPWFPGYNLTSITFANDSVGWVVSEDLILIKTIDGGKTWDEYSSIPVKGKLFAFDENRLIVSNYYSEDGGLTWQPYTLPFNSKVYCVYPLSFDTLFAGSDNKSIYKSTDHGITWDLIKKDTLSPTQVYSFYFLDKKNGWAASDSMYRTSDGGNTWVKVSSNVVLNFQFVDSLLGYAKVLDFLKRTTDGGITWEDIITPSFGSENYVVSYKASKNNILFLSQGWNGNASGVPFLLVSTDSGESWLNTNIMWEDFRINDIFISENGKVFICGEMGYVAVMFDSLKFVALNGEYVYKVFSFPDRVYALGRNTFYKVNNNGNNWETFYTGLFVNEASDFVFTDSLNGMFISVGRNTSRTTDGGKTWIQNADTVKPSKILAIGSKILVYDNNTLSSTTDLGINWTSENFPGISHISFYDTLNGMLTQYSTDPNQMKIFKTTDGGYSWEETGLIPYLKYFQFYSPDSAWGYNDQKFCYSYDKGIHWVIDSLDNPVEYFSRIQSVKWNAPGNYVIYYHGDWRTGDESLYDFDLYVYKNYISKRVREFIGKMGMNFDFYDDYHGWIAGGRGLFFINNEPTADVKVAEEDKALLGFTMLQNYPNPFNSSTRIKYSVASLGKVKISIFDILGREIQVLLNEEKSPGSYEINFNGSDLPSGIYVCKISSGSLSMSRKIVLLK